MTSHRPASLSETLPFDRDATATGLLTATFDRAATATGSLTATIGEPFGPYMVYEKLGEGGMACVHRAELVGEGGLRKPVALKRLHTNTAEDPDFIEAFVHEAQLAAKLHHPNIAQAYDLGKIDDTYYIAMELISGPTLAQVMTVSARGGAGAVPLSISLEILIQLCDALDHAHDLRDDAGRPLDLVHRDVSPMNVIISKTGCVKLIDFGIAKIRSARRVTEAGVIKGKHAYVAPEYTYGQLDRRADIFGLGVVAHELLTGRRLFLAETDLDTIRNVREMPIPPPSRYAVNITPELDAIVLAALERDPDKRWPNAGAMRAALTEEVRRLGVRVSGREIRDWAEWAFQQTPRSDSSVERMLDTLDPSKSISISIDEECPPVPRMSTSKISAIVQAPTVRLPTVRRAATVRAATGSIVGRAPTELAVPPGEETPEVVAKPARRRAPQWRPPTRWAQPVPKRSAAPLVLLALLGLAAALVSAGYIDIDRWRDILATYFA